MNLREWVVSGEVIDWFGRQLIRAVGAGFGERVQGAGKRAPLRPLTATGVDTGPSVHKRINPHVNGTPQK